MNYLNDDGQFGNKNNYTKENQKDYKIKKTKEKNEMFVNIIFMTTASHVTSIQVLPDTKIKDLLIVYAKKVGINPELIDQKVLFLFNGSKLTKNDT